jgi:hypothetical protein
VVVSNVHFSHIVYRRFHCVEINVVCDKESMKIIASSRWGFENRPPIINYI